MEESMECPGCGQSNPEDAKFCVKCGRSLQLRSGGTAICPFCGRENSPGVSFCAYCGKSIYGNQGQNSRGSSTIHDESSQKFASNIVVDIILTIITCGIYLFFWQARQIRTLNFLLREQRFSFVLWFFVSILTCFIFNIYYEYIMAKAIVELQKRDGVQQSNDLPVLSLLLSVFGLHVVADAIQQYEINRLLHR
jgi:hypothetical protein